MSGNMMPDGIPMQAQMAQFNPQAAMLNMMLSGNGQGRPETLTAARLADTSTPVVDADTVPPSAVNGGVMGDIGNRRSATNAPAAASSRVLSVEVPTFSSEKEMFAFLREKVHSLMRTTIGIAARGPWGTLPSPLDEGMARRLAPDGKTKFFNPNFARGITDPVNAEWVEHIILLLSEQYPSIVPGVKLSKIRGLIRTYLKTMRDKYKEQTTEGGKARARTKRIYNKRRSRKCEKAARRREQVPALVAAHRAQDGADNFVGIDEILDTDYMSSEHSDEGQITKVEWDARRLKYSGGDSALEVRKLHWRSEHYNRLLGALDTLARQQEAARKAAGVDSHGRRLGGPHYSRFPGHRLNANDSDPKTIHGLRPFIGLVSRDWVVSQHKETTLQMRDNPPAYSVLSVGMMSIKDNELDKDAEAYLGDDEADESDEDSVVHGE
ncbi:hypothetical protein BD626DRAFT_576190 [Schizophyllum amplum]|uniref:Uncharacterized protein n=1 Tax=Schizophyllum amplum TaxID=97359 RepID=A0A550BU29_9AGAR|nr:hypothetical protein BD626DRAFT_576190 [Auriculariopsis ampla]